MQVITVDAGAGIGTFGAWFVAVFGPCVEVNREGADLVTLDALERARTGPLDEVEGSLRGRGARRGRRRYVAAIEDLDGAALKMNVEETIDVVPVATVSSSGCFRDSSTNSLFCDGTISALCGRHWRPTR